MMEQVILPTVKGMAADGNVYISFLYAGLLINPDVQPKIMEFNFRFGDPETKPIMLRMRSDLVSHYLAATKGRLNEETSAWDKRRRWAWY